MKFYVVFRGHNPGVYDDWEEVKEQTNGFPGALFKGFSNSEEAAMAYRNFTGDEDREDLFRILSGASQSVSSSGHTEKPVKGRGDHAYDPRSLERFPEIDMDAWAVDASCLGNPGNMEYRGVNIKTGETIFLKGPFEDATNNIGEFLALIHAMALMTQKGDFHNIYSDSKTAMSWWRNKMVKTKLKPSEKNAKVFELLARATVWMQTHHFPMRVMKWDTEKWGEIPADFGRK